MDAKLFSGQVQVQDLVGGAGEELDKLKVVVAFEGSGGCRGVGDVEGLGPRRNGISRKGMDWYHGIIAG